MAVIAAIVSIIVLTFVIGWVLDKFHPACSSLDFANNDAYYAHLERRDRFFREEHVLAAALNMVLTFGVLSWFGWADWLPALLFAGGTFGFWCLSRLVIRRKNQMILWDRIDMSQLGLSILAGFALVAFFTGVLSPAVLPAIVFVVCFFLLFPL